MAYDPAKAHEYYEKYKKKGLKKERDKAKPDIKGATSLLGGASIKGAIGNKVTKTKETTKKNKKTAKKGKKTAKKTTQRKTKGIVLSSVPKTSTGGSKNASTSKALTEEQKAQRQALFDQANNLIQEVSAKFKDMTPQEKTKAKKTLKDAVSKLRAIANKI